LLSKLQLKPLISHIVPLQDIKKAFELHRTGKAVKILIKP
jgi:Zn-dependent alcohol dehydrogenase